MSIVDSVCRLLGVQDDEHVDENDLEFPVEKQSTPTPMAEGNGLIAMAEPTETTICVLRPERDELKGALYDIEDYKSALQDRQVVVLELTLLAAIDPDGAKHILDYLAGAVAMINGTVHEVTRNVFVFAPPEVKLTGDRTRAVKGNNR